MRRALTFLHDNGLEILGWTVVMVLGPGSGILVIWTNL